MVNHNRGGGLNQASHSFLVPSNKLSDTAASPPKCTRCGKCCIIFLDNHWVDCPFLMRLKTITRCSIYNHRHRKSLGGGFVCGRRKDLPWDIPDCPYNTGKPIHPAYK